MTHRLYILLACTLAATACDMPPEDLQPLDELVESDADPQPPEEPEEDEDLDFEDAPDPEPPPPVVPLHDRPKTEDGLPPVEVGDVVLAHMLPDRTAYGVNVCQAELWVHVLQIDLAWEDILSPNYEANLTTYARSQREAWGYDENAFILAGYRFD